ncbi:MAG: diguanylate cyclase [Spongiibacteraceae bacterium]|nr:diguanylate cyclase [Spongiibacteraceae bacterium]
MKESNRISNPEHLSQSAIAHMDKFTIPNTPDNYRIWYTYCADTNDELKHHINRLIKNQTFFTENVNLEIHKRYFDKDQQNAFDGIRKTISDIIEHAGEKLGNFDKDMSRYKSALQSCEQQLSTGSSDSLQTLIVQLLEDTHQIYNSTHTTNQSISQLSKEIDVLRSQVEQLTEQASTDALTGIANRRVFDTRYNKLLTEATHLGYSFSLLILDIDHFKSFNDKYGHTIGDMVLRFVANILDKMTKGQDIAARYGGEEFAILLPDTNLQGGITVAEKIRIAIAKQALKAGPEKRNVGRITVSIGVAQFKESDKNDSLIKRSDACLYKAKNAGRNRVVAEQNLH